MLRSHAQTNRMLSASGSIVHKRHCVLVSETNSICCLRFAFRISYNFYYTRMSTYGCIQVLKYSKFEENRRVGNYEFLVHSSSGLSRPWLRSQIWLLDKIYLAPLRFILSNAFWLRRVKRVQRKYIRRMRISTFVVLVM